MAEREQLQAQRRTELEEVEAPEIAAQPQKVEVDDLLDDIDSILESNASAFVQGFVQKGGQ